MKLVSFARDGATDNQIAELIGLLSVMQFLAEGICQRDGQTGQDANVSRVGEAGDLMVQDLRLR